MEELRIKCPSCGIVLEVRNSKNEAVKQINCPNCKKRLAVTFHEQPQPAQYVEIKMVQLTDGSQKTIVRALTDNHEVKVNGELLMKDDEVVLAPSDKLEIDGKSQFMATTDIKSAFMPHPSTSAAETPVESKSVQSNPTNTESVRHEPKRNKWYLSIVLIAGIVTAFVLWQKFSVQKPKEVLSEPTADTIITVPPRLETEKPESSKYKKDVKKDEPKSDIQPQTAKPTFADMSEYDLERLAMKGDAEAQCLLGKRWVNKGDSINVVKGMKYLKQAASNGSSEAKTTLRKVYATLQQSATNGNTIASNILKEQR